MKKIAILTNIPSPYRVDFFAYLQEQYKNYEWYIIFSSKNEDRLWHADIDKIKNYSFLKTKVFVFDKKIDKHYVHINYDVIPRLNKISPDVVISMEYNLMALQSLVWCKICGKKYINLTDGTIHSERSIGAFQKVSRRIICNKSDAFIASSTKAKEKLLRWGANPKKIFIGYLSVDLNKYAGLNFWNRKKGRILYVGSYIKRKGIDLLFDSLEYVKKEFTIHLVGNVTETEKEYYTQYAKKKNIEKNIRWIGFKEGDELRQEYLEANVFVLPTREDCFGLVLLEALAANNIIISSKYADGAYDVIEGDKFSKIIDPYDARSFSKAIESSLYEEKRDDIFRKNKMTDFSFFSISREYIKAIEFALG